MNNLAPIVLFVYNRPWHTEQTLEALSKNDVSEQSILYIYADGAKPDATEEQIEKIEKVRNVIRSKQWCKEVYIIESDKNKGLANSIIDGVTNVVNRHGRIIVLEDDVVTSSYFLKYLNNALNYYSDINRVWHIGAWNYWDIRNQSGAFFSSYMECGGGWATWKNRWQYFKNNTDELISSFNKHDIYRFNFNNGINLWEYVLKNKTGEINTWAIYWQAVIFQNKGLCLTPTFSFSRNIGFDGTGIHCGTDYNYSNDVLCEEEIDFSALIIKGNKKLERKIIHFYKKQNKGQRNILKIIKKIIRRIINKTKSLIYVNKKPKLKMFFKGDIKYYGTEYGGFYIYPDMLKFPTQNNQKIIIYSAGVGEDISFDKVLLKEFNCKVYAFDPTPKSINWVQKQNIPDNFLFFPYGIGNKTEEKCFYLPKNKNYVSGSIFIHEATSLDDTVIVQIRKLKDIAAEHQHTYIDILKMDIEGSEFAVIENLPKDIIFGQIVVEFHERFFPNSRAVLKRAINQLKKKNYYCFAISRHGDVYSFINKKEYKKRK